MRAGMLRGIDRKWPNRPALVVQVTSATSGLIALEPRLHPPDQVLHAAVGPVLVAAEGRVVHVGVGDLGSSVLAVIGAAVAQ